MVKGNFTKIMSLMNKGTKKIANVYQTFTSSVNNDNQTDEITDEVHSIGDQTEILFPT